ATIVSSSKQILDDDYDPPCIRAKREYDDILDNVDGWFSCTGDLKDKTVLEFEVARDGKLIPAIVGAVSAATSAATAAAPRAGVINQ
ncbi:metallohydrolase, partial [Escherichia coli]|nr:metallohydrolase [Escherichia coli]ELM8159858.1 metallohydrolase [Escherichia coli]